MLVGKFDLKRIVALVKSNRLIADVKLGLFQLVKILVDSGFISEQIAKTLTKGFTETTATSDQIDTLGVGKAESEALNSTDSAALDVSKPLSDAYSASDSLDLLDFGKRPLDTAYSADQINKFEMTMQLATSVGVTDDFDGAAVPDDDQTIQFIKALSNVSYSADNQVLSPGKVLTDSYTLSDSNILTFGKTAADSAATSDTQTFAATKPLSDSSTAAEAKVLAFAKPFTDGSSAAESDIKSFGKIRSDSALSSDSGTLLNQDYVDNPNYFADDYVGAKRTF